MKKLLMCGNDLYIKNIKSKLFSFITSRIVPFIGFTLTTIIIARLNYPELGSFSYLTAMFSLPVVLMSMPLAMIGNFSVESSKIDVSGISVFLSGLPLTLSLSLLGGVIAIFMSFILNIHADEDTLLACHIYVFCIPLLIINTYFFYYIESYISNNAMAKIKLISTFACAVSILIISVFVRKILTWHVFSIFVLVEIILLSLYSWVILIHLKDKFIHSQNVDYKGTTIKLLSIGLPVAFGLAGQKLIYFLITLKITEIKISLVSDLSVMMSIIGILSLPFSAFAQIHSLFVSENTTLKHYSTFKQGVAISSLVILIILMLAGGSYPFLLKLYNANPALTNMNYFLSICGLFSSSSLMLLCMSHLRALHDTLFPQMLAVVVLLLGFIPTLWLQSVRSDELYRVIYLQAFFTLAIFIVLFFRIKFFVKDQNGVEIIS